MSAGSRAGFSLIEALVGLAVAAMALLAVFQLQQQLSFGQRRDDAALQLASAERNALTLLADVNPTADPDGEAPLAGGRRLVWRAAPLGEERSQTPFPTPYATVAGSAAPYLLRLYRLDVDILGPDGRSLARFEFDRVGWRRSAGALGR